MHVTTKPLYSFNIEFFIELTYACVKEQSNYIIDYFKGFDL